MPDLERYFDRIGFTGRVSPTIDTLHELHRRHVHTVPFENLDVQLGRKCVLDVAAAFEKIVVQRRGGWCYEQNGLFGHVLTEIGFRVQRIAAAVLRKPPATGSPGDHLCLLVTDPSNPDRRLLADVGFGSSLLLPIPLEDTTARFAPFDVSLRRLADGYWGFRENSGSGEFGFDFREHASDEATLARRCHAQQTAADSMFVLNLVAQRRLQDTHITLRGQTLTTLSERGSVSRLLTTAGELATVLHDTFGLAVPEIADLWPRICTRHAALFGPDT